MNNTIIKNIILRILFIFLVLVSASTLPFIVTFILGLLGIVLFPLNIEMVLLLSILDAGYGGGNLGFLYTYSALAVMCVSYIVRKRIF